MKFLIMLFLAGAAHAAPWISLEASHPNLNYAAGDTAEVIVKTIHEPSTTGYKIRVFAAFDGQATQEVELTRGVGRWISPAL